MSSRIDLRTSRSLELLRTLEQTVSDFARREDQTVKDLRGRRFAAERKCNDGCAHIDERLQVQCAQVNAGFDQRADKARATHDARLQRIKKFEHSGRRDLPKLAQVARERFLGALQVRKFTAERDYASGVQQAEAAFARASGDHSAKLGDIEKRAAKAFRGYGSLLRLLRRKRRAKSDPGDAEDLEGLFAQGAAHVQSAEAGLAEFEQLPVPRFFSGFSLGMMLCLIAAACIGIAMAAGMSVNGAALAIAAFAILWLVLLIIHQAGLGKGRTIARELAGHLAEGKRIFEGIATNATAMRDAAITSLKEKHDAVLADVAAKWDSADTVEADFKKAVQEKLKTGVPRATAKNDEILAAKLRGIDEVRAEETDWKTKEAEAKKSVFTSARDADLAKLAEEEAAAWQKMEADWKSTVAPIYQAVAEMNGVLDPEFPAWSRALVDGWSAPRSFASATKYGHMDLDLAKNPEGLPKDARLALPGPAQLSVPLALSFPHEGSILFETHDSGSATVVGTLNNVMLRLLAKTPPGKVAFTIIDPVGLGQNFAGIMHIADHEDAIINRRIWTQRDQVEERLSDLNEHIEKVIQMYLRNEYATITEYNEQAGSVAEKYHFLVVADFPAGFSDTAAKRLQSIAISGPRCGVYTLIHWDQRQPLPDGFVADELRQNSVFVRQDKGEFFIGQQSFKTNAKLIFDPPPSDELAVDLVHKIGKASIDSNRVEVPFEHIAPKPGEMWTNETTNELRVAVGRTGATKLQYLAIGKGTRQHALFAGKTGSGKSTLFHVIITNLALSCSPDQVEFYLIDFKKGVEFKCYATKKLPHARVIAIESDREFGLSVLQRVDEELKRRGDIFRKLGVQDVAGYKRAGGTEPMPRSLLLIDEFQEFFVDDDAIAQAASLLFDRIVRQGRAFGIHVLLGSQTLGGAYTLARATLGQMVIRVALQCNEADAYLIMDENNAAPRLLSRPGEGIYNDAAGAIEGNSPFQVVWLSDDERDLWLDKIHDLAVARHDQHPAPIVFEGNAPSDIHENEVLARALSTKPEKAPAAAHCWLGAPNSIKGPTEAVFRRQSGNHLLIVGQREEAATTLVGASLISLAAQHPVGSAKFVLLHASNPESAEEKFIEQITGAIPHGVKVSRGHDIADLMNELAGELKTRIGDGAVAADAPPVFFFIHGIQKFKKLRHEDDFSFGDSDSSNPGQQLNDLICEGASHGIHLVIVVDTFNNVGRFMSRKSLSEIEMRVLFQMSQNDSASLIESPKAANLGLHRAIFYNEHEGHMETFRPYAMPGSAWIHEAGEKLSKR